jgi:hypothetical protein
MRAIVLLAATLLTAATGCGRATSSAEDHCAALANLSLDRAKITSASLVLAATAVSGVKLPPHSTKSLPAFCRVKITDTPSADSDTKIEIWLPDDHWNGKYRAYGNGGFAGDISYDAMATSITDRYATSATDAGHPKTDATFALGHPEKVKDFGWRAIHDMAIESKIVAAAFYGRPAQHTYFTDCSDGGREALMEAQRFPADFDGILAGAPAYNWTGLLTAGTADQQALMATPASYIPARKIPAIADAVRAACDAQDGVKDGILADPRNCKFDPNIIACKNGDADTCLMPEQIATLKTIYAAKFDAQGKQIYPGYLPGAEDAYRGWQGWIVGKTQGDPTSMLSFGLGFFSNFVHEQANWRLQSFNLDADYKLANAKTADALNATSTNLKPFISRGGRLVMYHGWNDPAIPALGTISYYDGLIASMGAKTTESAVRLYMVPGMLHCHRGPGATSFGEDGEQPRSDAQHDIFTSLEQWVEDNKAPATLTATKFVDGDPAKGVEMTRPLCPYPNETVYTPGSDSKSATSFKCVAPIR